MLTKIMIVHKDISVKPKITLGAKFRVAEHEDVTAKKCTSYT